MFIYLLMYETYVTFEKNRDFLFKCLYVCQIFIFCHWTSVE